MVATDNLYCVLKFTKNHVKREGSRKAACPFFWERLVANLQVAPDIHSQ
jgi:hypothetical protein